MGKLIKYELRNSRKPIIQIILIMMIASVLLQLGIFSSVASVGNAEYMMNNGVNSFQNILLTLIPIFILVALVVFFGATFAYYFRMANILKRDIYEDQGYIAFSIPKNGYQIIGAKVTVAIIWTIILPIIMIAWNVGIFMLLLMIFNGNNAVNDFYNSIFIEFPKFILDIIKEMKIFSIITWIINQFVSSIYFIILMFAAIVFDYNMGTRSKSSLRWIVWLLIFSITISWVSNLIFPAKYGLDTMMEVNYATSNVNLFFNAKDTILMMWLNTLFMAVISGLLFIFTAHNFENKIEK